MKTLSMMNEAGRTGKTYITGSMRYSVENGFHEDNGKPWAANAFENINQIMALDKWKVLENVTKKMTLKEIEDKLGHKIELVSG